MRAMLLGFAAIAGMGIGAALILHNIGYTAAERIVGDNVRVD